MQPPLALAGGLGAIHCMVGLQQQCLGPLDGFRRSIASVTREQCQTQATANGDWLPVHLVNGRQSGQDAAGGEAGFLCVVGLCEQQHELVAA